MTQVLRVIRKARWDPPPPWLTDGCIQADVLTDLGADGNRLSFYSIDDNGSNLQRVVAAYAATRYDIVNFDYALVSIQHLEALADKQKSGGGNTPDNDVNRDCHFDYQNLTTADVLLIAKTFVASGHRVRIMKGDIRKYLEDGLASKHLDRSLMDHHLLGKLGDNKARIPLLELRRIWSCIIQGWK